MMGAAKSRVAESSVGISVFTCTLLVLFLVAVPHCIADDETPSDANGDPVPVQKSPDVPEEQVIPFWRLEPGQTFATTSSVRRETELQVGEHVQTSDETDRINLAYGVSIPERSGGYRIGLRVVSMNRLTRKDDDKRDQLEVLPKRDLAGMEMTFRVADGGKKITPFPGESLLSPHDLETRELLVRLCGPDVFRSWVDVPFRVPVMIQHGPKTTPLIVPGAGLETPEANETETRVPVDVPGFRTGFEWTRPQFVSLGLLGTLRMNCQYRVEGIDGDKAEIVIGGSIEVKTPDVLGRSMLSFESMDLTVSDVSGSGAVVMSESAHIPESIEFEHKIVVEGTGVVRSGNQSHKVHLKQALTQRWNASEFSYRDEPQGFPIPMVR